MGILLADLRKYVSRALSGGNLSLLPGTGAAGIETNIINQAGRWFFSHHPWRFRVRPPTTLSFTADQAYVEMPADFGEMTAYQMSDGLNYGITFTTPQSVANHRSSTITVSQNYYWATFSQPSNSADQTAAPGVPRLELWPTPSASDADVITVWYRAKWTELPGLDEDAEYADVPDYAEFALAMTCHAFAAGLAEGEVGGSTGTTTERLEALVGGVIFKGAREADGLAQSDIGPMTGGAIQSKYPAFTWRSASASPVADPS